MRAVYVAQTDIPSRMAHSIQIMKNADAWASVADEFAFITSTTLRKHLQLDPAEIRRFYGLGNEFRIKTYPLHDSPRLRLPALRALYFRLAAQFVARRKPDLVYTRSYLLPSYMPAGGPPIIVETHGPPDGNPDKQRLYAQVRSGAVRALVTISERLRQLYIEAGLPERRIIVLADGFDASQFARPLSRVEAAQSLGLPTDRLVAGYVGHLYDHRGIEEILQAAARLPHILFLIVGGHDVDIARRMSEAAALNLGNIRFTGFVPNAEVPRHLWACDVLLMPYGSRCPTADWMSPLKLFEYMASGRPVICTDLPALKEVVSEERTAMLCQPDNAASLSDAIGRLAASETLRERLGSAGRVHVQGYSWQARVRRLLAALDATDSREALDHAP